MQLQSVQQDKTYGKRGKRATNKKCAHPQTQAPPQRTRVRHGVLHRGEVALNVNVPVVAAHQARDEEQKQRAKGREKSAAN